MAIINLRPSGGLSFWTRETSEPKQTVVLDLANNITTCSRRKIDKIKEFLHVIYFKELKENLQTHQGKWNNLKNLHFFGLYIQLTMSAIYTVVLELMTQERDLRIFFHLQKVKFLLILKVEKQTFIELISVWHLDLNWNHVML